MSSRAAVPATRYTRVAIWLHWLIAALLIATFIGGQLMVRENFPNRFAIYQWHKSLGMLILALSAARLMWRVTHRPPPDPAHMPGWQKAASHATHWAFYALMIGMPVLGWAMVSASPLPVPTVLFELLPLPDLPIGESAATEQRLKTLHHLGAKIFAALFVLHVGAALLHHFRDKDGVLARMAPWVGQKR